MKKKFLVVAMACASMSSTCLAQQAPQGIPKPHHVSHGAESKRMDAIFEAIQDRLSTQQDIWFQDGDFPMAIESLRVMHQMFPHDYDLLTSLGWMLENIHSDGEAISVYISYKKAYPSDPNAYYPEGEYYFRKKLYAKVPSVIEPSLRLASHPQPNAYRMLANSYEKLNLLRDSKRVWDSYLALNPNDGQAKVNRARVEKKLQQSVALHHRKKPITL